MGDFEEQQERRPGSPTDLGDSLGPPRVTHEQLGRKVLRSQAGESVGNDDQLSRFAGLRVPRMQDLEC